MKPRNVQNARTLIWSLCLVALLGELQLISAFEGSIAVALSSARGLNNRIASNESIIAKRSRLQSEEQQALRELLPLSASQNGAESVSQFMRNVASLGAKLRVQIISTNLSAEMPAAKPRTNRYLLPSKVTLLVRGRFASIVRFVQELTRQHPVTELGVPRVSVDSQAAAKGLVESTIQVTMYRLLLEPTNASRG